VINYKKYSILLSSLIILVSIFAIIVDSVLLKDMHTFNKLPKKLEFTLPYFYQKVHIDIDSNNSTCLKYIKNDYIKQKILYKNKEINIHQLNRIKNNRKIIIEIFTNTYIPNNCIFEIEIVDPYGNMFKELFFIVIPILIIFFLLFKMIFIFIYNKLKLVNS